MSYFIKNIQWLKTNYPAILENIPDNIADSYNPSPEVILQIIKNSHMPLEVLVNKDVAEIKALPFKNIKWLILDVDGTLTDAGMCFTEKGDEFKKFNSKDGMAITRLLKAGVNVAFLSAGVNKNIVKTRAEMLGVKRFYCGKQPKIEVLSQWMAAENFTYKEVAYIGDDINDLEVIENAAVSACPADAVEKVKHKANIVLTKKGGDACIREFADTYLSGAVNNFQI